jgi:ABC-type branched-subunit amino acid transport system ATPase component
MALSSRPRVLLLDEPFAGLRDEEARRLESVLLGLRSAGLSIMLVEHRMRSVMSLCDRVYVLDQGAEIAHGTPDEVAGDERVITAYLGRGVHA